MKKNLLYILFTVTLIVGVCYYLYSVHIDYDGGLIDSLASFIFSMPLYAGVGLWRILTCEAETQLTQKTWQRVVVFASYIIMVVGVIYYLINSKFYNLSMIILAILLIAFIPSTYWDYKKGGKFIKNPILNWTVVMCGFYALIFTVVFVYIKVVSPVTIEQATNLVAEKYGEDAYEFVGHINFHEGYNPIGVYWFAQRKSNLKGWVEVDLLTGNLQDVK